MFNRLKRKALDWIELPISILIVLIADKAVLNSLNNMPLWRVKTIPVKVIKWVISKK